MYVYDHQDAFARSYGDNVVTPLTCDFVRDKTHGQAGKSLLLQIADPPALMLFYHEGTKNSELSM